MKEYKPKVLIYSTEAETDKALAELIIKKVNIKPDLVMCIATGRTTIDLLPLLVKASQESRVDFKKITFFGLDEYWKIPYEHPYSAARRMHEQFLDLVGVPKEQVFYPDSNAADNKVEIEKLQNNLKKHGPLDLAVIGIGPGTTCHIGLNEIGSTLDSGVRLVDFDPQSRQAMIDKYHPKSDSEIPVGAITLGIADILKSKEIILSAKTEKKAWGINRSLNGPISSESPASFLRYHPNMTVVLDAGAAKELS